MSDEVRTRFAPSPTGYLHLGGLRTALYTYLFAKKHGGKFILRIEDTDQEREVPGAVDINPCVKPVWPTTRARMWAANTARISRPSAATSTPSSLGSWSKRAALTAASAPRKRSRPTARPPRPRAKPTNNKKCLHNVSLEEAKRRIAAGEPYVIRQNVPTTGKASFDDMLYGHVEVDCDTLDDNVLIKADGLPTYNFANVVDDHLMAISHVMRGTEYLSSAPKYNLLYEAFGWKPPIYLHLPPVMIESVLKDKETKQPILDENGNEQPIVRKLSKRWGDPSFEDLLQKGYLKEAIINYIALLGWAPKDTNEEFFSMDDLIRIFDENGINKSPSIFDTNKLTWFNAEYIRRLTPEAYAEMAKPWLSQVLDPQKFDLDRLCQLLQARTEIFSQLPGMVDFLAEMPALDMALFTNKKSKSTPETSKAALEFIRPILSGMADWTEANLHDTVMAAIPESGMKNATVLWPLRIAITGRAATPGGAFEMAYLLGKDETMKRLDDAMAKL